MIENAGGLSLDEQLRIRQQFATSKPDPHGRFQPTIEPGIQLWRCLIANSLDPFAGLETVAAGRKAADSYITSTQRNQSSEGYDLLAIEQHLILVEEELANLSDIHEFFKTCRNKKLLLEPIQRLDDLLNIMVNGLYPESKIDLNYKPLQVADVEQLIKEATKGLLELQDQFSKSTGIFLPDLELSVSEAEDLTSYFGNSIDVIRNALITRFPERYQLALNDSQTTQDTIQLTKPLSIYGYMAMRATRVAGLRPNGHMIPPPPRPDTKPTKLVRTVNEIIGQAQDRWDQKLVPK